MRVLSIPPGAPFLRTLVRACLDGRLGVPFDRSSRDFSAVRIYVPTRRAARALAHAFAEAVEPQAVLLPRILPLGDPSDLEDQALLAEGSGLRSSDSGAPAMDPLARRLSLARLIETWREAEARSGTEDYTLGSGFAESFALAGDLARLIDEVTIEGADWSDLKGLVDAPFDEHWRRTREFLEIAGKAWPAHLAENGVTDEAERRNRLLLAEAGRLRREPPRHPVIAAGSTGSVPATAELLAAIARLPLGAVVLPGLDLHLDAAAWAEVADDDGRAGGQPGHPQSALKRLLGRIGIAREDVVDIGQPAPALAARAAIVSATMRPAEATEGWTVERERLAPGAGGALAGLSVIEAADEREEALAIAVALRQVLEDKDRTAALVTPDRALAGRVATELRRWGIQADDSAGLPLDQTPVGALALLVLQAAEEDFSSRSVLAVLANACVNPGEDRSLADARDALELAGFRGVNVPGGIAGLARALDDAEMRIADRHAVSAVRRMAPETLAAARALLARTVEALAPLAALAAGQHSLAAFAAAHVATLEALAGARAVEGADGQVLARLLDALQAQGGRTSLGLRDYTGVFTGEARAAAVASAAPVQGRIKIWGLLEARLMEADRIVLGGLSEGVWPAQPRQDPFLNRAMRHALGLALPERRIGQSAHDFTQALGAPEVVLARARTVEGTPMVASRLLRRLEAFVGKDPFKAMLGRGARYIASARVMDAGPAIDGAARPDPRPVARLQPPSLAVTDIEKLFRDPYAIYARDVLDLQPLEPLAAAPDARDRGTVIHAALEAFMKEAAVRWPEAALPRLLEIGRHEFGTLAASESVEAFWWPAFEASATWFIEEMQARRASVARVFAERYGRLAIPLPDGTVFTLRGRGDLIERMKDGTLAVTDYKTGTPPSAKVVKRGLQPQLTLMAAMAASGAIQDVPALPVSAIRYMKFGAAPGLIRIDFKDGEADLMDTARRHLDLVKAAIIRLRTNEAGFLSHRLPQKVRHGGDYDHLARVREWMAAGAAPD